MIRSPPPPSGGSVIGRQKGREALSNPPWGLALEYAGQCVVHTAAPKAGGGALPSFGPDNGNLQDNIAGVAPSCDPKLMPPPGLCLLWAGTHSIWPSPMACLKRSLVPKTREGWHLAIMMEYRKFEWQRDCEGMTGSHFGKVPFIPLTGQWRHLSAACSTASDGHRHRGLT